VKEDLSNVHGELEGMEEEIRRLRLITAKQFPPSVTKGKLRDDKGKVTKKTYDMPDRINADLTRECGGNVHDCKVVAVTDSRILNDKDPHYASKNAADLERISYFHSAYSNRSEDIPHTRDNCL
jgi:hypothetical protein